jgi:DNA-binding response OmpR family regulator
VGEASILVVDDVAINRRLTDMLLSREGFQVHTSADAEQALAALPKVRPSLMLVDIELPGMDGLSLTRQVKQDPSTRDIVVLALSGRASTGDDRKAFEAGCDGYLTKPVDSATLVSRIREHLSRNSSARPMRMGQASGQDFSAEAPEADLETLRQRFLEEGLQHCREMLESLGRNFDARRSARLFHQWVGAAGILGYLAISDFARQAEEAVTASILDETYIRELLSNIVPAFSAPKEITQQAVPAAVSEALSGKPIGMVGFGSEEADRVCAALEMVGARPRLFLPTEPCDAGSVRDCSTIMISVTPETVGTPWLTPDSSLPAAQPLVLVGKREQIIALDGPMQSRASEFLIDGWQPLEALMRLSFALSRGARSSGGPQGAAVPSRQPEFRHVGGTPSILIADDDPTIRSLVRLSLEEYGMNCQVVSNGPEALQMIRDREPHAAVLDVNMPGMDGYLVLAAVREERLPVRVVLLTARKHENDISRGFNLGADDYVVKPFNAVELVARLKRLLRR